MELFLSIIPRDDSIKICGIICIMQKLELLAPAKDYNTALAAINCGADAIYIGANKFGARQNASNSLDDIKKIIDYAHLFNVKVYVTLNTIVDDDELTECQKIIEKLYDIKTDAIIVQDFGILYLALENQIPPIVIHISTQADIRTPQKVKFFEDIGAKRVILARELSLDKIEKIRKNTNIELEHFVHGALCVCYSGQCYMSDYIGSRSANRGMCAQACRKQYSLVDGKGKVIAKNKYLLSLKDNNLSNHIDKLIKAGVMSFKIEGRLKDINYIKNNVLYYNNLLKSYPRTSYGKIVNEFSPNPNKTFNRGYCDDYLFNKKDNIYNFLTPKSTGEFIGDVISTNGNSFVVKTKEQLNPQDGLVIISGENISGCLVNKVEKIKEGYKVFPNKNINLKIKDKVYRNQDNLFNKTLENSKIQRKLEIDFEVYKNKLVVRDLNSNKVELEIESTEIAQNQEKMKQNYSVSLSKTSDSPYLARNIEFKDDELNFLPVSKINELRRNLLDKLSEKILLKYKVKKQKPINIAKYPVDEGDYKLNVHNSKAKEFYEACGCKVNEMSFESSTDKNKKEIMRTKHCLKRALLNCSNTDKLYLVDEKNVKYPLLFDCKNCEMVILSP